MNSWVGGSMPTSSGAMGRGPFSSRLPARHPQSTGGQAGFFLVVSDIEAARVELAAHGVDVSEVFHRGKEGRVNGPDPERRSYGSLATFSDPDGNTWLLQEVTTRLPGRVDANIAAFTSSSELAAALRRAAVAHGEHEKRNGGQRDENWP
jgi:hypothetical protein